jgi:hypothetical protein
VDAAVDAPARPDVAEVVVRDLAAEDGAAPDAGVDVVVYPRRPACTSEPKLENGDFEKPGTMAMIPGWQVQTTGGATVTWEPVSGYAGTGGAALRVSDTGGEAVLRQSLVLEPYTAYTVRARFAGDGFRPRGDGPLLLALTVRGAERTWSTGPRKQDRTDFDYQSQGMDFATGAQGQVDIELRTAASGHFLVDEVTVACNGRAQRFDGQRVRLTVYDDQVATATPPALDAVVASLDKVVDAVAGLTGDDAPATRAAFAFRTAALSDTRGEPALWTGVPTAMFWAAPRYVPGGLVAALARNFDRPAWTFDDDFAELAVYYALETLDLRIGTMDDTDSGRNYRVRLQQRYQAARKPGSCADASVLVYKDVLLRDLIGWEPFKAAFRALRAQPPTPLPSTRWGRIRLFHDKLAQLAGVDVWAMFGAEDAAALADHYDVAPPPAPRRLADLPVAMTSAALADSEWESATVGRDRPSRNRLPSDCPMVTSAGRQPAGLYGYAFSQYVFRLGKAWTKLTTGYALQAEQMGSVLFIVRGDGKELFRSMLVKDATPLSAEVAVAGVDRLELIVTDGGDGNVFDAGLWLDPRLSR